MQKTVVAFGELLWDLLPSGAVLGGAPANFACRINSLGYRGILVSRLGRDPLGHSASDQLASLGMDTHFLQWDKHHPTGTVEVELDAQGNPDFFIVPAVAYDRIECGDDLLQLARDADCLCFGTLVQRAPKSRATLRQMLEAAPNALKLLDVNLRRNCHTKETIAASLEQADILKLNEHEATSLAALFGLPARSLADFGEEAVRRWELSHCVITLGERGAFLVSAAGDKIYAPGYQVPLADTCGSGDAFSAGFLHGLFRGEPPAACLRLGNALGGIVATQHGATELILPSRLASFLANEPDRIVEPALLRWAVA